MRARTELENVATEAMVRQCAKCKNRFTQIMFMLSFMQYLLYFIAIRFFKEEGCNKMKCPKCGQSMCYLCRYCRRVREIKS